MACRENLSIQNVLWKNMKEKSNGKETNQRWVDSESEWRWEEVLNSTREDIANLLWKGKFPSASFLHSEPYLICVRILSVMCTRFWKSSCPDEKIRQSNLCIAKRCGRAELNLHHISRHSVADPKFVYKAGLLFADTRASVCEIRSSLLRPYSPPPQRLPAFSALDLPFSGVINDYHPSHICSQN